jgi:hypothetical protein
MHGFQSAWTRRGHAWPRTEAGCRLRRGNRVHAMRMHAGRIFSQGNRHRASTISTGDQANQVSMHQHAIAVLAVVSSLVGRHVGSMCAKSLHDTRPSGHSNTGAPPCAGTRSCCGSGGSSLMGRHRRGGRLPTNVPMYLYGGN